jgi:hypothetical protein
MSASDPGPGPGTVPDPDPGTASAPNQRSVGARVIDQPFENVVELVGHAPSNPVIANRR